MQSVLVINQGGRTDNIMDLQNKRLYQVGQRVDGNLRDVSASEAPSAMIGACVAINDVRAAMREASAHERPVMIVGEAGSGKSLTASSIHAGSTRRDGPWVTIQCAAYAPEQIEAELFGSEERAVEGEGVAPRLDRAEGGSLYIDGICELPLATQQRLAELIDGEYEKKRNGEPRNVRLIFSTHIDLQRAIEEHRLHPDLIERFATDTIVLPPLRERGPDVRLLASWMLTTFRSDSRHGVQGFSVCAWQAFDAHTWPGNVQEMLNRIRRAIVIGDGPLITAADLGFDQIAATPAPRSAADESDASDDDDIPEWPAVELAVARNQGRLDGAATELHISKVLLSRMLASHSRRQAAASSIPHADSA
jgi:DNA-binding NtrC family response regulator